MHLRICIIFLLTLACRPEIVSSAALKTIDFQTTLRQTQIKPSNASRVLMSKVALRRNRIPLRHHDLTTFTPTNPTILTTLKSNDKYRETLLRNKEILNRFSQISGLDQSAPNTKTAFLVPLLFAYWYHRHPFRPINIDYFKHMLWHLLGWYDEFSAYDYDDYDYDFVSADDFRSFTQQRIGSKTERFKSFLEKNSSTGAHHEFDQADELRELRNWFIAGLNIKNSKKSGQAKPFAQVHISDSSMINNPIKLNESLEVVPSVLEKKTDHTGVQTDSQRLVPVSSKLIEEPELFETLNGSGKDNLTLNVEENRSVYEESRQTNSSSLERSLNPDYYLEFVKLLSKMFGDIEKINNFNSTSALE